MDINFDYYRIFYYVAKYGNITLAANALMCNQPNVTRVIKNLEHELGCTLFSRSNRGVRLTGEGEKLYAHVRIAVEQIEMAQAGLGMAETLKSGTVSLGTTEIALQTFLFPVLREFRRQFPGIRIRISNDTATQAASALKGNLVDFSVVSVPLDLKEDALKEGLKVKVLRTVQDIAICGQYFSELGGRKIRLGELAAYPLISLGARTGTYEMYSRWFAAYGLAYAPVIEAETASQILPLVKNDLGIGFVPEDFLEGDAGREVCRIDLEESIPKRRVILLKPAGGVLSAAAKALEQKILEGCYAFSSSLESCTNSPDFFRAGRRAR